MLQALDVQLASKSLLVQNKKITSTLISPRKPTMKKINLIITIIFCLFTLFLVFGCGKKNSIKLPLNYYPPVKRLTPENAKIQNPTVGGGKIAYALYANENYEIFTMDYDGSNQKRLTYNDTNDYSPFISPDSQKIIYVSFIRYGQSNDEVFTMDMDGRNQVRMTENFVTDGNPVFSTDGKFIAFDSSKESNSQIFIMEADGKNQKQLTYGDSNNSSPSFSPDGKKIAYASFTFSEQGVKSNICVVDLKTGVITQLTDNGFMNSNPSFSPNGKLIVFDSNRDGNSEIYIMESDGKNQTRLTNNTFMDAEPMFMPDGRSIVFSGHRSADDDIGVYVMDLLKKE
jgi:Tol biopolymer transport system component